jgi:hypothetical protein
MKKQHRATPLLLKSVIASLVGIASIAMPHPAAASEPGTIGVTINQLYIEQAPTKRGPFMVRRVEPSSAAADAGIQPGDVIVATDGKPAFQSDANEMAARLKGQAGSSIEVSVVKPDDTQKKITLVRKPYPPHLNPSTDSFSYVIPGNWEMDPRYPFPLPWSPTVAHRGFEDLSFAPGFDDLNSPEYHSYLILWWLDGKTKISAAQLQADMVPYFQGLAEQRGRNNHFKPDLSRVTARYTGAHAGPATFGGAPATYYSGVLTLYDRHGNIISLHSEAVASQCSPEHTAVFFSMSKEPRPAPLWKQLDGVRDSFKCQK